MTARSKGAAGEREFNSMLAMVVTRACKAAGVPGIQLSRNFNQAAQGGCDLDTLAPYGFAFEVKRHETLQINTWWKQICKAAVPLSAWPILAYRQNRQPWTFVVPARMLWIESDARVFMEENAFLVWFEKILAERLQSVHNASNLCLTATTHAAED